MNTIGSICVGQTDGYPFLYLVVGLGEDEDALYLTLSDSYDVYVGECFGKKFGVSTNEEISSDEEIMMEDNEIASISPEEVARILKERNAPLDNGEAKKILGVDQTSDPSHIDLIPETGRCVHQAIVMLKMAMSRDDLTQSDLWTFVNQAILDYDWSHNRQIYGDN